MNSLEFRFECLDGYYYLNAVINETVSFTVDTSIAELESKQNEVDGKEFIALLNKADIKAWDRHYNATGLPIEDCTRWSIRYTEDDKIYESDGEESYEPYRYKDLINALCILDDKAVYFKFEN